MDPWLFLRGIGIGFAVAAPIGPVGILCIRKALADGRLAAWAAGLGAALADTLFGAVVGMGVGVVADLIARYSLGLTLGGGIFMLVVGGRTWMAAARALEPAQGTGPGMVRDFLSTFTITMTNPGTIFGVAGVFAALGAQVATENGSDQALLVAGIFCGSSLWWATLTELTILARARISETGMRRFNHISGGLLMVFGACALAALVFEHFAP